MRRNTTLPTATAVAMPKDDDISYADYGFSENDIDEDTAYLSDTEEGSKEGKITAKMLSSARKRQTSSSNNTSNSTKDSHSKKDYNNNRLTKISAQYDLDGDGQLDEAEQLLRDRDGSGRGFLKMEEIYEIVSDQLRVKKSVWKMKRLVAALLCFVVILAVSNLGTSLASATLAKDLKADDTTSGGGDNGEGGGPPAMRIASTGKIASAQTVADIYTATEMTDEQLNYRRQLVLDEMEEDPHSHLHRRRRNLLACRACRARDCVSACSSSNTQYITFDSSIIPDEEFSVIEEDCAKQKNIYIKRRWGGSRLNEERNERNEAVCSRGTSVTVRYKKNKKKNKGGGINKKNKKDTNNSDDDKKTKKEKKEGNKSERELENEMELNDESRELKKKDKTQKKKRKNRDREVIIEQENGRVLHADCLDGLCYIGGTVLQGTLGDDCRVGASECQTGFVCQAEENPRKRMARYGTCAQINVEMIDVVTSVNAEKGEYCNADKGWDACVDGYHCLVDDEDGGEGYEYSGALADFGLEIIRNRSSRRDHNRLRGGRYGNNVGDCTDGHDSCAPGYGCVKTTLSSQNGIKEADDGTWSCMYGATNGMELRSSSASSSSMVGTCVATAGYGQTCYSDHECGRDGYCDVAGIIRNRSRDGLSRGICAPSSLLAGAMNNESGRRPIIYGNEDCTNDRRGCANGYTCRPSGIIGSDRWTCQ